MIRSSIKFAILAASVFSATSSASAQFAKRPSVADSLAMVNARAIADTGRMKSPYGDLKMYSSPGNCRALMETMEDMYIKNRERDTIPDMKDSLPTAIVEKGRECISRFTPATAPGYDMYNYLLVASRIKDTALMREIVMREVNDSTRSTYYKIHFLGDALTQAYQVEKASYPHLAAFFTEELKKFGKESVVHVISSYRSMKDWHMMRFDTISSFKINNDILAYLDTYKDHLTEAQYQAHFNRIYRDSLLSAWLNLPPDAKEKITKYAELAALNQTDAMSIVEMNTTILKASLINGDPAEMDLVAVFPEGASAEPTSGKVTIYYRINNLTGPQNTLSKTLASYLRLHEKYGPDKLEIVILTTVNGSMWGSPPLTPEAEANLQNWYIRQFHDLPFRVVVNERPIGKRRDGRLLRGTPKFDDFLGGSRVLGYIVGKDGKVKAFEVIAGSEILLDKHIEAELAR